MHVHQLAPELSVISPVFQAEGIVDELVKRIKTELLKITDHFEIILVEDGSADDSWSKIAQNCRQDPRVKGLKLSRNFGQHYAVSAGLAKATGKWLVIIDCDLQNAPEDIHQLLKYAHEGYEIVFTKRIKRKDGFWKSISARIYNFLFKLLSDKNYDLDAGSMTLFSRKVRDEFLKFTERDRLYLQILKWLGFRSIYVPVEHHERYAGKTSYSMTKLFNLALQGWVFNSDRLLKISIYLGFFLASISFLAGILVIIRRFVHHLQAGWASIFVLILFSTGLMLMSIGITGIYIGKIFQQSKNRPLYIIDEELNIHE